MGQRYEQISLDERIEISHLYSAGASIRQIASALDRSPSSVARELKRNRSPKGLYQPVYADQVSRSRRWSGSKLDRDKKLRDKVLGCLKRGWSPEQVSGRLARDAGQSIISHETISRFIYAQIARHKDYRWRYFLPRGKFKRGSNLSVLSLLFSLRRLVRFPPSCLSFWPSAYLPVCWPGAAQSRRAILR
ncbi:MAG: helix-turn-helix domain-containing protein [candidate division Zixibacteria bacterium]|nr:helix-turn-helix domain-containing protein [candidate division Zixibacteria bacterium]